MAKTSDEIKIAQNRIVKIEADRSGRRSREVCGGRSDKR
jgi:hypothetical protein